LLWYGDLVTARNVHSAHALFGGRRVVAERAAILRQLVAIGATELPPALCLDDPRAPTPSAGAFAVAVGVGERRLRAGFAFGVDAVFRHGHGPVAFTEGQLLGIRSQGLEEEAAATAAPLHRHRAAAAGGVDVGGVA